MLLWTWRVMDGWMRDLIFWVSCRREDMNIHERIEERETTCHRGIASIFSLSPFAFERSDELWMLAFKGGGFLSCEALTVDDLFAPRERFCGLHARDRGAN